jgi:hypothetical protein
MDIGGKLGEYARRYRQHDRTPAANRRIRLAFTSHDQRHLFLPRWRYWLVSAHRRRLASSAKKRA